MVWLTATGCDGTLLMEARSSALEQPFRHVMPVVGQHSERSGPPRVKCTQNDRRSMVCPARGSVVVVTWPNREEVMSPSTPQ